MKDLLGILFLLVFFMTDNKLHSQSLTRELGFRFTGFDTFQQSDIILKKSRKKPDKFMRYRLGLSLFNLTNDDFGEKLFTTGIDFALGWEKRKKLASRLTYFHGFEPALHVFTTNEGFGSSQIIGIELGYVFGFQYDISAFWRVSIETIPRFSHFIFMGDWEVRSGIHFWNLGFNTEQIALSVVYIFNTKTRPEL